MGKHRVWVWVALYLFCVGSLAFGADWAPIVQTASKAIQRLESKKDEESGICSAVIINAQDGIAVTAAHCVTVKPTDRMSFTVGRHHGEVVKINTVLDLAVVKVDETDSWPELKLAEKSPAPGADIAVLGFAFGIKHVSSQFGYVSQTYNDETDFMWLNIDLIFGDSGGAAINAAGELVGINSSIYSQGPAHIAAVVPVERIRDFVKKYLPKK